MATMSRPSPFARFFETPKSSEQAEEELQSFLRRRVLISTLPVDTTWPNVPLRRYRDIWFPENALPGVMALEDHFNAQSTDVLLATNMKSGTTWIKALAFAITARNSTTTGEDHPLLHRHPQECFPYLEGLFSFPHLPDLSTFPAPRIFATHMPYSALPASVTSAGCRIVYLCRDPKDALVSYWHFTDKISGERSLPLPFAEGFEAFCDGRAPFGPFWDHLTGYLCESMQRQNEVMFMWYEDLMKEPRKWVLRLAEFMGMGFTEEEIVAGAVEEVVRICSFESLSAMEVNKEGVLGDGLPEGMGLKIKCSSFFRKGEVGDWKELMNADMAEKLDSITEEKLDKANIRFNQPEMAMPQAQEH